MNNLIKSKVLLKNKNFITWSPPFDQRKSYSNVVDRQISQISRLVQVIAVYLEIKISRDKIKSELKKHFSFFLVSLHKNSASIFKNVAKGIK